MNFYLRKRDCILQVSPLRSVSFLFSSVPLLITLHSSKTSVNPFAEFIPGAGGGVKTEHIDIDHLT